jgi:hypothetical protein
MSKSEQCNMWIEMKKKSRKPSKNKRKQQRHKTTQNFEENTSFFDTRV